MATSGASSKEPPMLHDPKLFLIWKKRFEIFVKAVNPRLWKIIQLGDYIPRKVSPDGNRKIVKPESEWSDKDRKKVHENIAARYLLLRALPDSCIFSTQGTAQKIWESLLFKHACGSQLKDVNIRYQTRRFEAFRMYEGESIDEMYKRFIDIINSLKHFGATFTDERCVDRILTALTSDWDDVPTVITLSENSSHVSLDDVIGKLKVDEMRVKRRKERNECISLVERGLTDMSIYDQRK